MATQNPPSYARPPIIEAVIGITFSQPIKESALATSDRRFSKHYPAHQGNELTNLLVNRFVGADSRPVNSVHEQSVIGHRRMSSAMDEVAVLMPDSLTVSQLAPYRGWEAFVARFKRDMAMYKRPGTAREISRIGMRYINRVDIAASGNVVEHEQYLNLYPRVPPELGLIVGYNMQTAFHLENIGCNATLNTAPVPSPTLGHASFILDIDVYKASNLPMNDAGVISLLGQMRVEKNRIFEACITQQARKQIFGIENA